MSEEKKIDEVIQNNNSPSKNIVKENNEILNPDFLKSFETPQKLPEKRTKIIKLINYLQENQSYLKSLNDSKNLEHLYNIILTNLNENNNNFVISQINLIKILVEQILNNDNEQIKLELKNFFKKALPKLFDKFYLQNEKINKNLIDIFIFVIDKNILKYNDYFPLIENICIEEDEDYKINILNFLLKLINNNDNIYKEDFPKNIIDVIEKLSENKENESIKEIAGNIIKVLNERKNAKENVNDEFSIGISNNPLNQQDSKLAFSSFIKKISKAVREENKNRNMINNNININITEETKEKNCDEKNMETKNEQIENIEKDFNVNKEEIKKEEEKKDESEEKKSNNEINKENNNNIKDIPEKKEDNINKEQEDKNENEMNKEDLLTEKENEEKPKRIMTHIKRGKSNTIENKKDLNNNIEEEIENNNNNINEEQKENKIIKKENKNKKGIKTRITRSRKLGAMVKSKNNKEKEKETIKEEDEINNKQEENNNITISVNKINSNKKEEEQNNELSPLKETEINNDNNDIIKSELNKEELSSKENNEKELEIKEPINNSEEIHEKQNENQEDNLKNMIEDFDSIPIITKENNQLMEDNNYSEENGIQIPKKVSIDDFNKKIDSALEQEQEHQEQIDKESTETNEKTEKEIDDPKYDEIKLILGTEICDLLLSNKWENKKHALEQVNSIINEGDTTFNSNDLFNYIKIKLKNFKETNFNIIREALNIFISLLKKRNLSKDNLLLLINIYYEKITDIKLKDNFIELIITALEESVIDLNSIINNLISKISKKKNPKILNEYSNLFIKLIEENDIRDLPITEIVNFCKLMAGNSNPQVRTSATNLICVLYKYLGEDLKPLLKDIKESTMKMIEAELSKVTIIEKNDLDKNKNIKKIIKKNSKQEKHIKKLNEELNSNKEDANINIASGPIDISKKINIYLKDLSEGKWSEKKEALENIENILIEANNKILPTGLNDFFILIKSKLSDGNKNYVKMLISLLSKFISALKKDFKPWSKMIALSLIPNLSDKNQSIRNECEQCFDIWVKNIGIDNLVIYFPPFLKNENVEIRIEIMKFIKKYNELFSKTLAENIYKDLIDGLLICLQDRSNNVRNEAEDIIILSLDYIDIEIYYKKIKDFKPVIEKDLKQILDNLSTQVNNNEQDNEELLNDYNNIIKKQKGISPYKTFNLKEKIKHSLKMKKSANLDKSNNINLSNLVLSNEEKLNYNSDYLSGDEDLELNIKDIKEKNNALNSSNIKRKRNMTKTADKKNKENNDNNNNKTLASNSTVLRSNKNVNNSIEKKLRINRKNTSNKTKIMNQIFNANNNIKIPISKTRRIELDKKFKFSIDTISRDDINKLKEYSKILFIDDFNTKIFENNLNKEIDFFNKLKNNLESKENLDIFFENLDIILKIISLKINNNYNPSLLKHFFSLLNSTFNIIKETGYQLNEIESNIILCLLVDKISINNNQIKENPINLIRQYSQIIDMNKIFLSVLSYALNKSNKVKSRVLDMTLEFHLNKKINMTSKNYIKVLSKYLLLNDNIIKSKCIKIFRGLQEYIKDEILNSKDIIGDKEKNILENNLINNEDNGDNNYNEEEENEEEYNYENNKGENIDDKEEEIYDNNDNDNDNVDNNLNKYYLSEERYQNMDINKNESDNNSESINNEEKEEENFENENIINKIDKKLNKNTNNYYMKTDNKFEEKQNNNNTKQPIYYKNTEIISKIQKIKTIKKNKSINDNSELKPKVSDKFSLPKKIIVKQKKNSNVDKKLKVFNKKINKSQNLKQKFKNSSSNKNLNYKSNNINNNYINNNIINNYYNNDNNNDNNRNSNGNSINNNNDNNGSNVNTNNDLSISLYNELNLNSTKNSSILSENDLLEIMNNLFSEDESEKMGTIIIIHEILCSKYQQNKYVLIPNIDNIIKIIIQITHELFENIENLNNKIIPLKFAKYLATILCKITSNKEFIIHISYKVLYDLCFELLNYLLINGLDKIGSNQEGNIIFKSLNSAMLRVLENCDTTSVILALLEIVKQNQNNNDSVLLCNLAMKCLFKVTRNINEIVDKIQLDKILLQMHLLTYNFDKQSNGKETSSQSGIMIIRFIKNFIIDIVKIKKREILEDYNRSIANNQYKDKYIYNWITNTLESLELSENEEDNNNIIINNELSKSGNIRSTSSNMNKNRLNNTDKKKENGGFNFEGNNNNNHNNLNKKSVIIVKKHASNNINNRYNINNYNTQSGINNITATKSSILGSSNISNNNRINVQKSMNAKNAQIYNKGGIKDKKKYKFNNK